MKKGLAACLVAWAISSAMSGVAAQTASATTEQLAKDLREEIVRIPVTVKNLYGREETQQMPVTIYRPVGDGPFPLLVFNHGRATPSKRVSQGRYRPDVAARYFTAKGLVVMVPTRIGYWETYSDFDPEDTGNPNSPRFEAFDEAVYAQVMATVNFAKTLPYVDTSRWLVGGQSAGGHTSVVVISKAPPGLIGGINFAGGSGGNPDTRPGNPYAPASLESNWAGLAKTAKAPMIWLYWPNDKYWGPDVPKSWHKAWLANGGRAEFPVFPRSPGEEGHHGLDEDMDHWLPHVDAFLGSLGFTAPAIAMRPPATGFAAIDDVSKVPVRDDNKSGYQQFLGLKIPRAFAFAERGGYGLATGDYAIGRAMGRCQRFGFKCSLYAVDHDVVWRSK